MLKNLDSFVNYIDYSEQHERPDAADLRLATAVVLIAAAFSDQDFAPVERASAVNLLSTHLNIPRVQAESLIAEAQNKDNLQKLDAFATQLREKLDIDERVNVLALSWRIIAADQVSTADETMFEVKLRQQLGLSMEQGMLARKLSEHITIDGFKEVIEGSSEVVSATKTFRDKK
jgi:uncharacterized tellurite resistance protein B-like protein